MNNSIYVYFYGKDKTPNNLILKICSLISCRENCPTKKSKRKRKELNVT